MHSSGYSHEKTWSRARADKMPICLSWVSLYTKSPYNALRFVLVCHICSFNYLCLLSLFLVNMRDNKSWSLTFVLCEKVSFRVDMQCSSLRAEAFLVFDKGSQPTLGQQITDMRPTDGQQSADCWQKIFVKVVNDSRTTVGRLSANSGPTVGRLLADCRPTVGRQFFGGAVLHFSQMSIS